MLQAFVPHIAVHTSEDTRQLVKDKGFDGGLWELLRPFGERIQGKVTVRDSVGAGKTYDDFAVRFVELGDGLEMPALRRSLEGKVETNGRRPRSASLLARDARSGGDIAQIEALVDRHLTYAEDFPSMSSEEFLNLPGNQARSIDGPSPFYTLYLRRLLSGLPMVPHESFSHPVACVIAISSRNTSPIEALRRLYDESTRGEQRLPMWVNTEYLRYYVLVHDEERDDIIKSMALFEQMKRHFGLHCHLLRLRSSQCVATDDDSVQLPRCQWIAAQEELAEIQLRESQEDPDDLFPYIYESDTTAIKTFIREMVTQSVVPSMERCVSTWNDQVASRRRGISGRFMSLSKKWGGFGTKSSSNGITGSSSNYDSVQGFYRQGTPEALMRKLADYAFMLRDWKLAQSTYELLRSDFNNDKAWRYHAAANEMAAVSTLLLPTAMSSKVRAETVDLMLETSSYSYITRCGSAYGALRCLLLGMELLRLRGGSATDDAARWGARLLENKLVGPVGDALVKERIAICHASKLGTGSMRWGARNRKAALWNVLAADSWLLMGKAQQAQLRLGDADAQYAMLANKDSLQNFGYANEFLESLRAELTRILYIADGSQATITQAEQEEEEVETSIGEESEAFLSRPHRKSLIGAVSPLVGNLESAPLNGMAQKTDEKTKTVDDDFQQE